MSNGSLVTTFFLTGLPHAPALDTMLFGLFLVIYILTVLGNLLILLVIRVDSHLHTPMYYFLTNLSFIDICFLLIVLSYVSIVCSILRIRTSEGRHRAFQTCASHCIVVLCFFGPGLFIYLRPGSRDVMDGVVAVFYTVLTPLLNPVVYTLRNKEVKKALLKLKDKLAYSQSQ
uniref:olfactory receptor 10G9-like n=1 Tax=Urocitellus parryii TaxID=9999 RepID=UPI000E559C55|nr:olfactory receptor 10G9-like [Urocitellus parryii]